MMDRLPRARLLVTVSAVILGVASFSVSAQQVAPSATPGTTPSSEGQEILVTAQRRVENKQDVPVTITVLDGELIDKARVQTVQDITNRTPGLAFDAYPASEPRLSVRGISSSARGAGGDPSTAIFIDEIYYGRPAAITFEAFDVQRVEVLKGPQGTLFGRNVSGGAISFVNNPANPAGVDAAVEASYGNFDRTDLAGFINVPIADGTAAVRATGTWRRHDGYVDRIVNGAKVGDLDDQDSQYGRVQLYVEPDSRVRIDLRGDFARDRAHGPGNRVILDSGRGSLTGRYLINPDRYESAASTDGLQNRDTWGFRANLSYDLDFATLSYLGSYRELDYRSYYDFDGSARNPARSSRDLSGGNQEHTEFYSNELQLRALPASRVKWVVGLYGYNAGTTRDDLAELTINGVRTARDYTLQTANTDSKAVYADVTLPVTSTVNVFGGARYTRDEKNIRSTGITNAPGTFFVIGDPGTPGRYAVRGENSWNAVTWRGGADWHVARDLMFYASVARGFKSGGYQDTPTNSLDARTPARPEYATNYEIGQRGQFFGRRLTWNNSIYFTDYTDLQTRTPSGLGFRVDNASAEIYGLESELNLRLGGFGLSAAYAYTHARFTRFLTVEDGVAVDYDGNRLQRIPDHKVVVSPSYRLGFGSGASLEVAADYAHESRIYDDTSNQPPEIRRPTNFVDARAILTAPGEHWSLSFWGKNLTNEKTRTYQGVFGGILFGAYNPPRTYGATLRWAY